jgi:hypothetical protein
MAFTQGVNNASAMKTQIPDALKSDLPQTTWGKLVAATPVFMAVVATLLAGLASSEMTRAQYARALAAQQQSKAGDQWGLYQAKRVRGSIQSGDADMLRALAPVVDFDADALKAALAALPASDARARVADLLDSPSGTAAATALQQGHLPAPVMTAPPAEIKAAIDAIVADRDDAAMLPLLKDLKDPAVAAALDAAKADADAYDQVTKPITGAVDKLDQLLSTIPPADGDVGAAFAAERRSVAVARMRLASSRYDAEAKLNQAIANGLELQVRRSNLDAEHHHLRSRFFFFGMLAAQLGVVVSTLAMAVRQRSLVWGLGAASGLVAVVSAVVIYLFI